MRSFYQLGLNIYQKVWFGAQDLVLMFYYTLGQLSVLLVMFCKKKKKLPKSVSKKSPPPCPDLPDSLSLKLFMSVDGSF